MLPFSMLPFSMFPYSMLTAPSEYFPQVCILLPTFELIWSYNSVLFLFWQKPWQANNSPHFKILCTIKQINLCTVTIKFVLFSYSRSLQHSMEFFYRELPQLRCTELQLKMRFATEKSSSWAKHEVGCELTSSARKYSRQMSVLQRSVALWGCSRQANWVYNTLWKPQWGGGTSHGKIGHWVMHGILQLTIVIYSNISEIDSWQNFKLSRPKISQNWTKMA